MQKANIAKYEGTNLVTKLLEQENAAVVSIIKTTNYIVYV